MRSWPVRAEWVSEWMTSNAGGWKIYGFGSQSELLLSSDRAKGTLYVPGCLMLETIAIGYGTGAELGLNGTRDLDAGRRQRHGSIHWSIGCWNDSATSTSYSHIGRRRNVHQPVGMRKVTNVSVHVWANITVSRGKTRSG